MAVPGFQDLMLPFLQICSDGKERTVTEVGEVIAKKLQLSEDDLQETMTSGRSVDLVVNNHRKSCPIYQIAREQGIRLT